MTVEEHELSRRSFVKVAAAASAAAGIGLSMASSLKDAGSAWAEAAPNIKTVKTMCHGCIQFCALIATVENGVVTKLQGDPSSPLNKTSICIKGLNQLHTVYSPRHVLHPMRHIERGTNDWETISWDEAIDLAVSKIKESIDKYGNYSFFVSSGGGGAYSGFWAYAFCEALQSPNSFEPGGAQCFMPRASMAPFVYGGRPPSIADSFLWEPFNTYNPKTEMIVLWGAQPSISQTALSGRGMADLRVDRGCKTVVVDPSFTADAAKADVWLPLRPGTDTALILCWWRYIIEKKLYDEHFAKYWTNLPFLINPLTRLPYRAEEIWPSYVNPAKDPNDEFDTPAYVCFDSRTGTVQPLPFSSPEASPVDPEIFTTVEVNGTMAKTAGQIYREEADEWTLDKTAEFCWLKADKIEQAIKLYADAEVAGIAHGVATDQTKASSEAPLGLNGLDCLMGYVDKPGACLTHLSEQYKDRPTMVGDVAAIGAWKANYGIGFVVGKTENWNRKQIDEFPDQQLLKTYNQLQRDRLGLVEHKGFFWQDNCHIPTILKAIRTGEPYKPRVWYEFSGNKLAMLGNAQSWFDVLNEIDYVICQYPNLTSFHFEACDLFLPTQEWLEWNGTSDIINNKFMFTQVIHLGETVNNCIPAFQILDKYRKAINEDGPCKFEPMPQPRTEEGVRKEVAMMMGAPDYDELVNNQDKYVPKVIPPEEYWKYYQYKDIVSDGLPGGFATESRKCEPYATILLHMARNGWPFTYPMEMPACKDYNPICVNVPPNESPGDDPEYPLVITSGRVPYYHHGTMRHAPFSRELYPVPMVKINPKTAADYDIKHMDWVKVSSRRGSIAARAYLTEGEAPGQLWMERFWNPEAFDASQAKPDGGWRQCNINVITDNYVDSSIEMPWNNVYGSYTLRGFQVKIEKGARPANIWVEPKEFEPFMPTLHGEPQTGDVF